MKTITYYTSKTGSTKFNHIIYFVNDVSIKSQSALILLNEYYAERDVDKLAEMKERQDYFNRRHLFLLRIKKERGSLECHYCHKKNLEVGFRSITMSNLNNKNPMLATIDHKVPVVAGIDILDESNWLVSCKKCNGRKGSRSYEDFTKNINTR